jgi:hypothetical protein
MELGVYTFAELRADQETGKTISAEQRVRNLLEEIELAEQAGLDVFGVGEHHRPDFVVSAPAVVLGAAAVRTERIRLTSAVTVLSSDDPVTMPHDKVMRAIELLGSEVAPAVRKEVARRNEASATPVGS